MAERLKKTGRAAARKVEAGRRRDSESRRLQEDARRVKNWTRWGPYLSDRQWGTVREDYSADGDAWNYFSHDMARSRVYRWGEDGLLGITDRECRLCFGIALWNGRDPILKERLFGLTNPQGNHGEDVKECYYYLDSTPSHSYMKALYKYPQGEFPYQKLIDINKQRGRKQQEYELLDTGVFDDDRYFDVFIEYAKSSPNNILIRLTIVNRAAQTAELDVLATLWFRNTWFSGSIYEDWGHPTLEQAAADRVVATHLTLGEMTLLAGRGPDGELPKWLFTENETNYQRLYGSTNPSQYAKDAFHEYVVHGDANAINPNQRGTKAAGYYHLKLQGGQTAELRLRLLEQQESRDVSLGRGFERVLEKRKSEADVFYDLHFPAELNVEERAITRQAYAGLLWSKQFYYYVVKDWLEGDPKQPPPPEQRKEGRNHDWGHLFNRNVLSMPDKWEYPWYAVWDWALQMLPFARIHPDFAKQQLILPLREWFMKPNGQVPSFEYSFNDVDPPVHAWACWRVYKIAAPRGGRDFEFLERTFQKLLLNFTWWVNRKDVLGKEIFGGGFLGMDNIGVFDRSMQMSQGQLIQQADGTAWVAFYCLNMLAMALELAETDPAYEDMASKFFNHFIGIADAMNCLGGRGLWDEGDGFYYDAMLINGEPVKLKIRSLVGLVPLLAVAVLDDEAIGRFKGFKSRMNWFLENRKDLAKQVSEMDLGAHCEGCKRRLLAIPSHQRLVRVLGYMLDEKEFLSPFGVRSLSLYHREHPFEFWMNDAKMCVTYEPGESTVPLFGGNSNWRGPIWMPLNYLFIEALENYHHFFGDSLKVECPTGSGRMMNLMEVARELTRRVASLFLRNSEGGRPWAGGEKRYDQDPNWRDLTLFHEYFDAETGRGLGASHQTGWTSLIVRLLEDVGWQRSRGSEK